MRMVRRWIDRTLIVAAALALWAAAASAQGGKPLAKCPPDAVVAGTVCMDKYEASVWRVPNPTTANKGLVKKIRQGKAKIADLAKGGATQLGTDSLDATSDDYGPCLDSGQNCADDIYAVSLPTVTPSTSLTWFQAQAACTNARKRLPTSAEWQVAVTGTPDPGADDGTTDCNTTSNESFGGPTGSRSGCVSAYGAFDMVGNVNEWVAEWLPRSTGCGAWNAAVSLTADTQCLVGAAINGDPGGVLRGGGFADGTAAGPLAVGGSTAVSYGDSSIGFRCAR